MFVKKPKFPKWFLFLPLPDTSKEGVVVANCDGDGSGGHKTTRIQNTLLVKPRPRGHLLVRPLSVVRHASSTQVTVHTQFCTALGQMLVPICSWANASGHLLVGQLLATINACLPQCLWYKCLCQTACAQTACVNLLVASQKVNLLVVKLLAGQLLVFSWCLRC